MPCYKGLNQEPNQNKNTRWLKATSYKLGCGNVNLHLKMKTIRKPKA